LSSIKDFCYIVLSDEYYGSLNAVKDQKVTFLAAKTVFDRFDAVILSIQQES